MKDIKETVRSLYFDDESTEGGIKKKGNYIIIIFGKEEDLGKEIEIKEEITVGRSLNTDLTTSDPLMSRRHFKLTPEDENIFIEDLGSLNGTFVNQQIIDGKRALKSGDIIIAGRTVFKFEIRTEIESLFHKYLYNAATSDRMTNLFNKYYFISQLKKQISYAKRYGKTFSLLMIDIDDFKKVNDTYGHQIGDEALKFVAFKIMSSIRENDIAARYGGEEFSIILPETDSHNAFLVAKRIRKAIASEVLDLESNQIKVTVSIGVATFPEDADDWKSLIKKADERLYKAKEAGKNIVISKEDENVY